jgi:hypothetical protein
MGTDRELILCPTFRVLCREEAQFSVAQATSAFAKETFEPRTPHHKTRVPNRFVECAGAGRDRLGHETKWMEKPVTDVFGVIPPDHRDVLLNELDLRNPTLLAELREAREPTNAQSDAVVATLCRALSANFGPGHIPNEYGLSIERAVDAYLEAWPIIR